MGIFTECARCDELEDEAKLLNAEIERLREDNGKLRAALIGQEVGLQSEIERLREVESNTTAAMIEWEKRWRSTARENERLRGEATQLRQALGMLTTLHPTMEIDVNNPMQMAKEIVSYVTESKDAEIERLREELARIRDQIAKHNISIKEAIRRGEAFEWKTLTLDS